VTIGRRLTKLPSTVERKAGYCVVSTSGANVKDISALVGGAVLSEELDSLGKALISVDPRGMNKAYLQRDLRRPPK